jgi:hypothetical protein
LKLVQALICVNTSLYPLWIMYQGKYFKYLAFVPGLLHDM